MSEGSVSASERYRFGDAGRSGAMFGLSVRQGLPIVIGVLWLTMWLMAEMPLIGLLGPVVGLTVAFGRWRKAPLFDVAVPGVLLLWRRTRHRSVWVRGSLLGQGLGYEHESPRSLEGLELLDVTVPWLPNQQRSIGVVRDGSAGSVSVVVRVSGNGFAVASLREQDGLVGLWGAALGPLARAQCAVSKLTWQEWSHPVGIDGHVAFLESTGGLSDQSNAGDDYRDLLDRQAPFTIAHEVLVTLTVEVRRVRSRRQVEPLTAAIEVLTDETRLLIARLESSDLTVESVLSPVEVCDAIRVRSDPTRLAGAQFGRRRSLSAAAGRGPGEWGPMAVEADWLHVRVDGSFHRSYRIALWPMLPVTADWLSPLLTGDSATRTVTMVFEPVPLARAAKDANRQLTSIEADRQQKERHGFRLTAGERRRQVDVETRERELAEGHPEFRHVGIVTVTADSLEALEDASARVEQAAAQSLLDLRPLAARQAEGWVTSLPLGRSVRQGTWPR